MPPIENPNPPIVPAPVTPAPAPTPPPFEPKKRRWPKILLIVLNAITVLPTILLIAYVQNQADKGFADAGLILIVFFPLILAAFFTLVIDFIFLARYLFRAFKRKDFSKPVLKIVALLLFIVLGILLGSTIWNNARERRLENKSHQPLSRSAVVNLVDSCKISSFLQTTDTFSHQPEIYISYTDDSVQSGLYTQHTTKPENWQAMVGAAESARAKGCNVTYTASRTNTTNEWITLDDAKAKLLACTINTFNYGGPSPFNDGTFGQITGAPTGVQYIDAGSDAHHIYVDADRQNQLIPTAQAAQKQCGGKPQFAINGQYQ